MVGPTTYLMRADSATVARVWSRNTTTKISAAEDASAATGATSPSTMRLRPIVRAIARAPTSSGATAISPWGASVTLNTATMIAAAAGHSRLVPMEFSTRTHTAMAPNAISGSGRSPLLNGSHAARNTAPAESTVTRLPDRRLPSLGNTQWLMISQVAIAAAVAGRRIHTPAVLTDASCASTL